MKKELKTVLKEMCDRVGADFEDIDFGNEKWFMKNHSWTEKEEEDFVKWFTDELMNNASLRKKFLKYPRKNKKKCRKAAQWFCFEYGWRLKDV